MNIWIFMGDNMDEYYLFYAPKNDEFILIEWVKRDTNLITWWYKNKQYTMDLLEHFEWLKKRNMGIDERFLIDKWYE